jgi:tetratricopeptide (TPR) repeat protein
MIHPPVATARHRPLPSLRFLLALLVLAALAVMTLRSPPRIITGLPEGPLVERMRASLWNRLRVDTGDLRLQAALLGGEGEPDAALAIVAESTVLAAIGERPDDPRLRASLAFVDLAAQRFTTAQRHYREAIDRAPTYGEARLGLGVTLALRAASEADGGRARGLRLRAISQLAAVPEADPCYEAALYDRVLLLARVGRVDEARRWARAYLARDPLSPWAVTLSRELPGSPE